MGASLLVFKNKSDVPGCMTTDDIREVCALEMRYLVDQILHF